MLRIFMLWLLAGLPLHAWALHVTATTASMGLLAREIGGETVRVTVLAPSDRDPHALQARPSMMRALRDADLVVAVGAELEAGWMPAAIGNAGNPNILPGRIGYFEAAAQVPLLEAGQPADRARGDVHPMGNPHIHLDPQRMIRVAHALAERLARMRPNQGEAFRARAEGFERTVSARMPHWRARAEHSPGAVLHHKDGLYLMTWLGRPVLGYLEPVPGVPPTAAHLERLASTLQGHHGVVLRAPYQPARSAEFLARRLGWEVRVVPMEPPSAGRVTDYLGLIDAWVDALASAGR